MDTGNGGNFGCANKLTRDLFYVLSLSEMVNCDETGVDHLSNLLITGLPHLLVNPFQLAFVTPLEKRSRQD